MTGRERGILVALATAIVVTLVAAGVLTLRHRSSDTLATVSSATTETTPDDPLLGSPLVSLAPVPSAAPTTAAPTTTTSTTARAVVIDTSTSVPATFAPTSLPAVSTTASTTSTTVFQSTPVTGRNAVLTAPSATDTRKLGTGANCLGLVDSGFSGTCGRVATASSPLVWLTEVKANGASRAYVFTQNTAQNTATVVLQATDDSATDFEAIRTSTADIRGDGTQAILFGFHLQGSSQTLSVDVVDGSGTVVVHRDLAGGAARASIGQLDDWRTNTTGSGVTHEVIRLVDESWRIVSTDTVSQVPTSQV